MYNINLQMYFQGLFYKKKHDDTLDLFIQSLKNGRTDYRVIINEILLKIINGRYKTGILFKDEWSGI